MIRKLRNKYYSYNRIKHFKHTSFVFYIHLNISYYFSFIALQTQCNRRGYLLLTIAFNRTFSCGTRNV